jgi:phage-related protein
MSTSKFGFTVYHGSVVITDPKLVNLLDFEVDWRIGGITDPLGQIANWIVQQSENAITWAVSTLQGIVQTIVSIAVSDIGKVTNSIYNNVVNAIATIQQIWNVVGNIGQAIATALTQTLPAAISAAMQDAIGVINTILTEVDDISKNIQDFFTSLSSILQTQVFTPLSQALGGYVKTILSYLQASLTDIYDAVTQITTTVNNMAQTIGTQVLTVIQSGFAGAIAAAVASVTSALDTILGTIQNLVSTIGQTLASDVSSAISGIVNTLTSTNTALQSWLTSQFPNMLSSFNSMINNFNTIASGLADQMVNAIKAGFAAIPDMITGLEQSLSSFITQITSAISGVISTLSSDFSSIITLLETDIASAFNTVVSTVTDAFNKIESIITSINLPNIAKTITDLLANYLSSIASQITATLDTAFTTISGIVTGIVSTVEKDMNLLSSSIATSFDTVIAQLNSGLSYLGSTIGGQLTSAFTTFSSDVMAWFQSLHLPSLSDFTKALSDWWSSTPFSAVTQFPAEFMQFMMLSVQIMTDLTAESSPSALTDIINFFKFAFGQIVKGVWEDAEIGTYGAIPQLITLLTNIQWNPDNTIKSAAFQLPNLNITTDVTTYFTNLGKTVIPLLSDFANQFQKVLSAFSTFTVDQIMTTFNLPAGHSPAGSGAAMPFGELHSSLTQKLIQLATLAKSKTPIPLDVVNTLVEEIGGITLTTETAEWLGLTADVLHPMKNLQLKDKLKDFFNKIGLGHVSAIIGATITAACLSPPLMRFWNKTSQVQLPNAGSLLTMWHRGIITETDLGTYLSEHGFDSTFVSGLKEESLMIPSFNDIGAALARIAADAGQDGSSVASDIAAYFPILQFNTAARSGFKYADSDIMAEMIYNYPSRFERRVLNLAGLLTDAMAQKILVADRMRPDLVPLMMTAERLQGSLTYRNRIESAISKRVIAGYALAADFSSVMSANEYPTAFINYLSSANALEVDTTLDSDQLNELNRNYIDAIIDRGTYMSGVQGIITNPQIASSYIAIRDLAAQRTKTYTGEIKAAFSKRIILGFDVAANFASMLSTLNYAQSAITYLTQANALEVDTALDQDQLHQLDENYVQQIIDRATYVSSVQSIIVNSDIAKSYIAIRDAQAQRTKTYVDEIKTAFGEQVKRGYALTTDFTTLLSTLNYSQAALSYLTQAYNYTVETTISNEQITELDRSYTEAIIDRPTYVLGIQGIIVNTSLASAHIAVADQARARLDLNRLREEGRTAVNYELLAFAEGSVSQQEFESIAAAMGKTPNEIAQLEEARELMLEQKIRDTKFKALQYLVMKWQITPAEFVQHCLKLPLDSDLAAATADYLQAYATKKASSAPTQPNEGIFVSFPSLP